MNHLNRRRFLQRTALFTAGAALAGRSGLTLQALVPAALDLAHDPLRPQYHLLPRANWMNDPNGPVYWHGQYHMFYQYNPNGAFWGDMHWGHAVSKDMIHWRQLPVALTPTPGGDDTDGCFTGSAIVHQGKVSMIYTAVRSVPAADATLRDGTHNYRETQCLATAEDAGLERWSKLPAPVIASPPARLDITGFRDPCPWHDGDWWYLNVGSGIRNRGGIILLYRSRDLHTWEYLHPLATGKGNGSNSANSVDTGEMWECPDFFPLGEKHVLIYSTEGKVYWQSGTLDRRAMLFQMEKQGLLDYGSFYAPKTQLDAAGNRILWGWIPETRSVGEHTRAGWAGMMSLPRVLTLDSSGRLVIRFASQVDQLLSKSQTRLDASISNGTGAATCVLRRSHQPWSLSLAANDAASEKPWLAIEFKPDYADQLVIDGHTVPLGFDPTAPLSFRFLIDGSVIEMLISERVAYTKRFYYAAKQAPIASLSYSGDAKDFVRASVAQVASISSDRLTT